MKPEEKVIETFEHYIDSLLQNRPVELEEVPPQLEGLQARIAKLSDMLQELKDYASDLGAGNVDTTPPSRRNYLASGLKQLQSQMLHLTWQTQRVAKGDYLQRIDFMGEFSSAFNEMVDQLHTRELSLMEAQEVMERIFNMLEPIIVTQDDDPTDILYANEMAEQCLQVRSGKSDSAAPLLAEITAVPSDNSEYQVYDGENKRWYAVISRPLQWGNHENAKLFYCRDITVHKKRESTLDIEAHTDPLTGIHNRRFFDQRYEKLWSICMSAQKPLSIAFFDLDHFKQFNDTYGHQAGDKVLQAFAKILEKNITRADDIVARYGGEEFIAAIPFATRENAMRMARNISAMTASTITEVVDTQGAPHEASITVSCGICTVIPSGEYSTDALITAADNALYQAKQNGRNQVVFSDIANAASPASS